MTCPAVRTIGRGLWPQSRIAGTFTFYTLSTINYQGDPEGCLDHDTRTGRHDNLSPIHAPPNSLYPDCEIGWPQGRPGPLRAASLLAALR